MAPMDGIAYDKVQPAVRKVKKKQVKGELDLLKQAEKKKRRLEKALATSAAIRSELEKKKQKKKEEQQRLDEEGAAIAEAVALHVLIDEDSDDSGNSMQEAVGEFNPWNFAGSRNLYLDDRRALIQRQDCLRHPLERVGWVSNAYKNGCNYGVMENSEFSFDSLGWGRPASYFENRGWGTSDFSAGLIAAQAVSSLQIAEDTDVDAFFFNEVLRG